VIILFFLHPMEKDILLKENKTSSDHAWIYWRTVQVICWLAGFVLLLTMFIKPDLGVMLLWNGLIPVAPALLVVATGLWRNICPLGTTSLLPDRFGVVGRLKLTPNDQARLHLAGVILLLVIIPLRHILFNTDGRATGLILVLLGAVAFSSGLFFDRKSAWCSGICPVHPVEKLYGSKAMAPMMNAHCIDCIRCSVPCPDSTPISKPFLPDHSVQSRLTELLLVGAFPGYIWGWFQTPDYIGQEGWQHLGIVYGWPVLAGTLSALLYIFLRFLLNNYRGTLVRFYAAAAVSIYYWYRIPLLFGFDKENTHSQLIDLSQSLPYWLIVMCTSLLAAFFMWWFLFRENKKTNWAIRPALHSK
jgi:hypothetical protein